VGAGYGVAWVVNIKEVRHGHVRLEKDCVDRISLNEYAPQPQVAG
jgi:hypothetical protein